MTRTLAALLLVACSNGTPASKPAATTTATPAVAATPTPTPAPAKGSVETHSFASAALGVEKDYVVYLPAGYATSPNTRYPVFYYLHGLGGNEHNWVKGGALDEAADTLGLQAIVVMPDGDDDFYIDSSLPIDFDACMKDGTGLFMPGMQPRKETCVKKRNYETYIIKDLIAEVDAKYRTIASREGRAIAGLSMGGFGALQLGMRHPDLFAAAASHSGVDALLYEGPVPYEKGKVKLFDKVVTPPNSQEGMILRWLVGLFGKDIANWRAHDPATLAAKVEAGKPALYLDCGTEDVFQLNNGAMYVHDILTDRKIEHAFYIGPGKHDFTFWKPRLPESLKFLRDHTVAAK